MSLSMALTVEAIRVLGALVEKDRTTPEYYPLSLNALMNACNQKSNREPVMALAESDVARALEALRQAGLALQSADGGRVLKYSHNVMGKLQVERAELALLGELLLRGPQTAGELRARAERMHHFEGLAEVEAALQHLMEHEPPLVAKLPRQPGRKESRYAQLLGGAPPEPSHAQSQSLGQGEAASPDFSSGLPTDDHNPHERIARLEEEVGVLRAEVKELWKELRALTMQPDPE